MKNIIIFLFLLSNNIMALDRACFSPDYHCSCEKNIIELIDSAKKSISIVIYSFNNENIMNALIKANKKNIKISIIYDRLQHRGDMSRQAKKNKLSIINQLNEIGIETIEHKFYKIEHSKFMIVDDKILQTGSFNYTNAAENKNEENCIFIKEKEIVKIYQDRFIFLKNRFFKSSKICSNCGIVNNNLTLKDREWTCNECRVSHNRDFNASVNISLEGLRIYKSLSKSDGGGIYKTL